MILEQAGEAVFSLVEELRNQAKAAEQTREPALFEEMHRRIRTLDLDEIFWLIRSYTAFFHLANEAERQEIARINGDAERSQTERKPRGESILEAMFNLKEAGQSYEDVRDLAARMEIEPTLTAHPTEARRGSILFKQNRIAQLLAAIPLASGLSAAETERLVRQIHREITLLMATDDIRADRLRVEEEVETAFFTAPPPSGRPSPKFSPTSARPLKPITTGAPTSRPSSATAPGSAATGTATPW